MINTPINDYHKTIAFAKGDGIGPDITKATRIVADAAWDKEYGKNGSLEWHEIYIGMSDKERGGDGLSNETIDIIKSAWMSGKAPLYTPVGGGFKSYNVKLRNELDLYACIRPIKYYPGTPTTHLNPNNIDALIVRETTEDVYSGYEYPAGSETAKKIIEVVEAAGGGSIDPLSALGIKNITQYKSERLIKFSAELAEKYNYQTLTLVHKGNIQKYTEGAFRNRGYDLIKKNFDNYITENEKRILRYYKKSLSIEEIALNTNRDFYPYMTDDQKKESQRKVQETINSLWGDGKSRENKKVVNDIIADNLLQQAFINPHKFGVLALTNLNGDYASDAFAGVIGGLGIASGANYNPDTGVIMYEATHGTAADLGKDQANPSSLILSFALGSKIKGHEKVAARIEKAIGDQILSGRVTGDFYNTAKNIHDSMQSQTDTTPGINHLKEFAKEQYNRIKDNVLGTQQFAEEIAQRIADQD